MPSHATDEEPSRLSVSIGNVSPTRSPTRSQAALSTHNRSVSQPHQIMVEHDYTNSVTIRYMHTLTHTNTYVHI